MMKSWISILLLTLCSFSSVQASELNLVSNTGTNIAAVTLEQLSQLPQQKFTIELPWVKGQHTFIGVKLTDLLSSLNIKNVDAVRLTALNDYTSEISIEDITQYQPIITYKMDGGMMTVRKKGPFWMLYDLSKYPDLTSLKYQSHMVWQLKSIQINPND
ncbi:molybdopterin-dependent oxidoreductase [Vibrio sp.]|nr:molybdopterin-dependent oxidoreductase [Vibrio sp.]